VSSRGAVAWLALLAALATSAPAAATTATVLGIGPSTRSLAGAGVTQAVGYEAAFQNPAGLALAPATSLSAGYGVTTAWLYTKRGNEPERRFDTQPLGAIELGFTLPFRLFQQRFVLGFAGSSPGGSVAQADLPLAEAPQFPLLLSRQRAVDFDLGLGLRPFGFLAFGIGVRALSTLSGTAEVERTKQGSSTRVNDTLVPVLAPLAGVTAFFGSRATLALVARAPLRADFDIQLGAVDLGATQLPPLNLTGVAHYDPLALQAEYAQHLGQLEAMFGAVYQRFSATPTLLPRTVSCPAERPDCLALTASSPQFHDTFDLHVAAALSFAVTSSASAKLRAGYAFVPSPIPEQAGSENLLDGARHRLGLGYGLTLLDPLPPLALDCALTYDQLVARTSRKQPDVAPDNLGSPTLRTRGHLFGLSLGLTVRL
jgi:hypothetical protein